jgi:protein tyrosine phosphatase
VELLEETVKEYTVRKLKLTPKKAEPRIVYHFQFKNWPDFHVPEDTINFEKFVEEIRDLDDSFEDHKPIITHCSAG